MPNTNPSRGPWPWIAILSLSCVLPASGQVVVYADDISTETSAEWTTSGPLGASDWTVYRSGTDWGARRHDATEQLELSNDISAAGNSAGWVFASVPTASFPAPYDPVLATGGVISWTFNMRQIRTDPAGFDAGNYGVAFILAGETATAGNTGVGYAVVLGQSGSTDPLRLVRYTDGIQGNSSLTNLIISNTTGLEDFGNEHLSVRVTFNPCAGAQWELFVRNDGASFADPAGGTLVSQGTAVDATHTGASLGMMAAYWQGSTAANQTAFFDNITVTVTTDPAISLDNMPVGCTGAPAADLFYTATTGGPDVYSISWDPDALAAGFVNVNDAILPASPIQLSLPMAVVPGTYTGSLVVTDTTYGCESVSYPFTLGLTAGPAVGCPQGFDICSQAGPVTLTGGIPAGGTWTGPGVTGNVFDPSAADLGDNLITYIYADTNGCEAACTFVIHVLESPVAEAGTYAPACTNDPSIPLAGMPVGGAWSGPGVIGETFDPTAGTQDIFYAVAAGNGCVTVDTATMVVNPCIVAPEMRWVLLEEGVTSGSCTSTSDCDDDIICFGLQYTPDTTGTLTSYTTGFLVDCLDGGNPVLTNASCVMSSNSGTINDCGGSGLVLLNASGNSGNLALTKNVPVILHQVCFQIPAGSILVDEDTFTDLTASIDIPGGSPVDEYPAYFAFDIDSVLFCGILPLRFLDFEVRVTGMGEVRLDWTTADEVNNDRFEVQRSVEGSPFEVVGEVPAIAEPTAVNAYRFVDRGVPSGRIYYRLRQVDRDGRYQYSPLRVVRIDAPEYGLQIAPNPARDFVDVRFSGLPGPARLRMTDLQGRVVMERDVAREAGVVRLDTGSFPAGMYLVTLTVGREIRPFKLVLDR